MGMYTSRKGDLSKTNFSSRGVAAVGQICPGGKHINGGNLVPTFPSSANGLLRHSAAILGQEQTKVCDEAPRYRSICIPLHN